MNNMKVGEVIWTACEYAINNRLEALKNKDISEEAIAAIHEELEAFYGLQGRILNHAIEKEMVETLVLRSLANIDLDKFLGGDV